MTHRTGHGVVAALLLGLLGGAGCSLSPRYVRPDVPGADRAAYVQADSGSGALSTALPAPLDAWWTEFGDPGLDSLVAEAFRQSPTLESAAARVLAAQAVATQAKAPLWPGVDLSGSATRRKSNLSGTGIGGSGFPMARQSFTTEQFGAVATASWEVDLWGKLRDNQRVAWANLLATEEERRAVTRGLVAGVVSGWLEVGSLEAQVALGDETIRSHTRTVSLVESRYERGLVGPVDVHLAGATLASARAQQAQLEERLTHARQRLEVLVGRYPEGAAQTGGWILREPPAVPPGLPATLLEERPDVRSAEHRLRAATAGVGVARAGLLPRITLTGEAGWRSEELADLLKDATSVWSLAASVVQPLFHRGAKLAAVRAAEASRRQAQAEYVGVVLNALREVEAALVTEVHLRDRRAALAEGAEHARRAADLAETRYARGVGEILTVLDARRQQYATESNLIAAERDQLLARVALIQALGGYWDAKASGTSPLADADGEVQ